MRPKMIALLVVFALCFTATTTYAWGTTMASGQSQNERRRPAEGQNIEKKEIKKADLANLKDGTYTGSAEGYSGLVTVEVVVKLGKITALKVLSHTETPGYYENGAKVIEAILKAGNLNVDTISGATLTSQAIIEATSKALEKAGGGKTTSRSTAGAKKAMGKTMPLSRPQGQSLAGKKLIDGTYTGSNTGYNGSVSVQVTIENGKISAIDVLSHAEDEPYFSQAKSLISQVISNQGTDQIEAVSGATFSSNGILGAINQALTQAIDSSAKPLKPVKITEENKTLAELKKLREENNKLKLGKDLAPLGKEATLKDGEYIEVADGYAGEVKLALTVKNGKIVAIDVKEHHEDEPYFTNAKVILNTIIDKGTTDGVDVVTGATFSSKALLNATTKAIYVAAGQNVPATETGIPDRIKTEMERLKKELKDLEKSKAPTGKLKDGKYKGSGRGYHSETNIEVEVTIENEKIKGIDVINHSEDEPYFSNALSLLDQIVAKGQTVGIEAVSGATRSSNGLIRAINAALGSSSGNVVAGTSESNQEVEDLKTAHEDETYRLNNDIDRLKLMLKETLAKEVAKGPYNDGNYTGVAEGYRGKLSINLQISEGKIASIVLKTYADNHKDDQKYLGKERAELFINQFIGKDSVVGVDTISNATFSTRGLINAVNRALKEASGQSGLDETQLEELKKEYEQKLNIERSEKERLTRENNALKKRIEELEKNGSSTDPKDTEREYEGIGKGYSMYHHADKVPIRVKLLLHEGLIKSISVEEHKEDPIYWKLFMRSKLLDQIKDGNGTKELNYDETSGATYSARGAVEAINEALSLAAIDKTFIGEIGDLPIVEDEESTTSHMNGTLRIESLPQNNDLIHKEGAKKEIDHKANPPLKDSSSEVKKETMPEITKTPIDEKQTTKDKFPISGFPLLDHAILTEQKDEHKQ